MLTPLVAPAAPLCFHWVFRTVSHTGLLYLSPRQLSGGNKKWNFLAQSTHQTLRVNSKNCSFGAASLNSSSSVLLWAVYEGDLFLHQSSATEVVCP